MLLNIIRYVIAILFGVIGYMLALSIMPVISDIINFKAIGMGMLEASATEIVISIGGGIVFFILGLLVGQPLIRWGMNTSKNLERVLARFSGQDLLFGTLGLAFGLIIANLIGLAFHNIPIVGPFIPVVLSAILGYLGVHLMIRKRTDMFDGFLGGRLSLPRIGKSEEEPAAKEKESTISEKEMYPATTKLLDTSVVIDGRIAEICQTGFLEGTLIAPLFVLEELQKISDSSDALKRTRGRRGLDILQEMQNDEHIDIQVIDNDYDDISEVDSKLMRLALEKKWKIVTNDFNLNKVATLQGIGVLNINDLANALKPARVPGEWMRVQIIKAGKENAQGIAYLDDGTMIVVENGVNFINQTIDVMVTSVLQTSAGRMIFARPDGVKE